MPQGPGFNAASLVTTPGTTGGGPGWGLQGRNLLRAPPAASITKARGLPLMRNDVPDGRGRAKRPGRASPLTTSPSSSRNRQRQAQPNARHGGGLQQRATGKPCRS